MIYEMRIYRTDVHMIDNFVDVYTREGVTIISRYAKLIGCWQTESGELNNIVFIWAYDSYDHRIAQREKLWNDNDWLAFVPSIRQYMVRQESIFLTPVAFSPLQ